MRLSKATALALGFAAAMSTNAFAFGCGGNAAECYEKVRLPDAYATVARPVLIHPGYSEVVHQPAVVINRAEPYEIRPGSWRAVRTPAVYGTRSEQVLVSPGRTTYEDVPAETRTVHETIVEHRGSWHWERRVDLFGHERMCKVVTPPVTRTVERTVVVAPARRIARRSEPVYATVNRPVLLQPESVRHVYEPPLTGYTNRPVVVQAASARVITHPPVTGYVNEQVLVRRGGYAWARSGRGFGHGLFDDHGSGHQFGREPGLFDHAGSSRHH